MAEFNVQLTKDGADLLAKAISGQEMRFTRVVMGDADYSGNIYNIKDVISPRKSLSIIRMVLGEGQATVRAILRFKEVAEGFHWREIGLYAKDMLTETEVLYAYGNARDKGDYIPSGDSSTLDEKNINIMAIISNAQAVTAVIDESLAFVTKKDLGNKVDKVDGKQLSSNDYTTDEKDKLDGVEIGANNYTLTVATTSDLGGIKSGGDITINSSGVVAINDDSHNHVIANVDGLQTAMDGKAGMTVATATTNGLMASADKVKLDGVTAGANNYTHPSSHPASMITQDETKRFVTDTEKATWNGKAGTAVATTTTNGLMASADKVKLDSVAVNANNYVHPNDANTRHVSDTEKATWNGKASTAIASTTVNGLMAKEDKVKLNGIATNANNYIHPANHPASVITQDANNRLVTDAEKTTWNGKANKLDTTAIFTHAKAGTIHTLTGTAPTSGFYTARFKAVADFVDGDTFKVNNVVYVAQDVLGEAISGFKVGAVLSVEVDIAGKKVNFKSGGGSFKAKIHVQTSTPPSPKVGDYWVVDSGYKLEKIVMHHDDITPTGDNTNCLFIQNDLSGASTLSQCILQNEGISATFNHWSCRVHSNGVKKYPAIHIYLNGAWKELRKQGKGKLFMCSHSSQDSLLIYMHEANPDTFAMLRKTEIRVNNIPTPTALGGTESKLFIVTNGSYLYSVDINTFAIMPLSSRKFEATKGLGGVGGNLFINTHIGTDGTQSQLDINTGAILRKVVIDPTQFGANASFGELDGTQERKYQAVTNVTPHKFAEVSPALGVQILKHRDIVAGEGVSYGVGGTFNRVFGCSMRGITEFDLNTLAKVRNMVQIVPSDETVISTGGTKQ